MATAVIGLAEGELASLLGTTFGKAAAGSIAGFAATDIIKAIYGDLTGGSSAAKANASKAPRFAIVDMHTNTIVRPLSSRKVYSILTHPSRRGRRNQSRPRVAIVPSGSELVTVR
jgi:hypothetical protein